MTRKDYVLISNAIRVGMSETTDRTGAGVVALHLAYALKKITHDLIETDSLRTSDLRHKKKYD